MRKQWVMGNWKMHGSIASVTELAENMAVIPEGLQKDCVVFPPSIFIPLVSDILKSTSIGIGVQNIYPKSEGAFTGEISARMAVDFGCRYVLVGHSERRHIFGETEKYVAEKFHHAKDHGMIPVLCVGETLTERNAGQTEAVLKSQLDAVMQGHSACFEQAIIAYEPVWAIGTGQTATPEQAQEVHSWIRGYIAEHDVSAQNISIMYGGSVNEKNAQALFAMPDIDGGLVGGASLKGESFLDIVKCMP